MNRAARIADKATCGQVWCSASAWESVAAAAEADGPDLDAFPVGRHALKGVPEPVDLMQCLLRRHEQELVDTMDVRLT